MCKVCGVCSPLPLPMSCWQGWLLSQTGRREDLGGDSEGRDGGEAAYWCTQVRGKHRDAAFRSACVSWQWVIFLSPCWDLSRFASSSIFSSDCGCKCWIKNWDQDRNVLEWQQSEPNSPSFLWLLSSKRSDLAAVFPNCCSICCNPDTSFH